MTQQKNQIFVNFVAMSIETPLKMLSIKSFGCLYREYREVCDKKKQINMLIFDTQISAQRCAVGYYALSMTSENRALLNFAPDPTRGFGTLKS